MYTAKTNISRNNAYPYLVIFLFDSIFPPKVQFETYQIGFMTH